MIPDGAARGCLDARRTKRAAWAARPAKGGTRRPRAQRQHPHWPPCLKSSRRAGATDNRVGIARQPFAQARSQPGRWKR
eukprot:525481-Rhodomonas_salina.4